MSELVIRALGFTFIYAVVFLGPVAAQHLVMRQSRKREARSSK